MTLERFVESLVVSLVLGSAVGCGTGLMDGGAAGEPHYVVQGEVKSLAPAPEQGTTRAALAWDNWAREGDITTYQSVELTRLNPSADYQLRVVENPPDEALNNFRPGLIGFAYLIVYQDVDGNGVPNGEEADNWDSVRGMARNHVVVFVPELTSGLKASLREWGRIVNVEDLKPGFNLARGVCVGTDSSFDDLEIVPNEPVPVADPNDTGVTSCLNYH
ncbi:hypothetical protein JY651_49290 [Pyxidicoccus parkwayensis]|uniref:Lipoprotein n=1 Tax=Pyxidicoccus parkwayensis TaxID=2813578 RepID=A0ABX7NX97_9BACT|nr:hypothetical protein [Pyxidicoccus parkwaysis]QSQ23004.1 hypothetical protein JY651_49290 [Pyxidicoccus parkwaysis]